MLTSEIAKVAPFGDF